MQALLARLFVWCIVRFKLAVVPSSDELFADTTAQTAEAVKRALDKGGWKAAQSVIDAARAPGKALFDLQEWVAVLLLMGLPGSQTPQTPEAARRLRQELKRQYDEAGDPNFLFTQVHAEAVRQLKTADETGN
jgi:poly-gamma-glutamate capsule biosynthesis protein CapA/YwtB (metallophosphatase superfamily)